MSKKKKLTWICATAAIVSSCLFFTGCPAIYPDLSEIAPTSYGDWDGYYLYHGNVRSKTTGEDDEYLVQSVEKDGVAYRVAETTDHTYVGEEAWLCLTLENTESAEGVENAEEQTLTCLMRYNLRTQEASAVYFGTDMPASYVHKIGDSSVLLSYWTGTREVYFLIDYNGNVLNENAWEYAHNVYYGEQDEYVLTLENGIYSYALWETGEYTAFYQAEADATVYVQYLKQGEKEGFLLHEQYVYVKDEGHITSTGEHLQRREDGLLFYDITTGETTRILDKTEKKVCTLQGEYVVIGGEEIFESRWLESFFPFSCETQHNAELLCTDCALYQIDLSGANGATLKKLEAFDGAHQDEDFTNFSVLWDGTIAFNTYGIERGSGCYSGGPYANDYFYDLKTGELTETDIYELYEKIGLSGATACGTYFYYEVYVEYDGGEAYTLYRYDTETEETEAMQFWISDLASMEYYASERVEEAESGSVSEKIEFRFSQKMWYDESGYSIYPIGEYLVLDY